MVGIGLNIVIIILLIYIICKGGRTYFTGKKTVFYFYSPNCGYCTKFNPIWDKIVDDHKHIDFRKIDCKIL